MPVVVTQRTPQPRGLDQQLQADLPLEVVVAGGLHVPPDRVGDVRTDVEARRAGRPVRRALLPADGPPREGRALQAERLRALPRKIQSGVPPAQHVGGGGRLRVRQRRQHERLGVPERVAVVAGTGQALGPDRPLLGTRTGLQRVEEAEADRLLHLGVALDDHVGVVPELVEVFALLLQQALPAVQPGTGERAADLVTHGRQGAVAGPAVRGQLHHAQLLTGLQLAGHRRPQPVRVSLGGDGVLARRLDQVLHRRGHAQVAGLGAVHEQTARTLLQHLLGLQRVVEHRRDTRVLAGHRELLVGDQLGLQDHACALLERLDLVHDRDDRTLGERHHAYGADADRLAGRRHPLDDALQGAGAQVQDTLVGAQVAVPDVERLIVDQQPHQLGVGDVDHRLAGLGEAVPGLGVRQRAQLVERVEVGAGETVRLALVQVAAYPDVTVGQGKDRFGLSQQVQVEPSLPDVPRVDGVSPFTDHGGASRSERER